MKKLYLSFLFLASIALGFTSCSDDDHHHDYVTLDLNNFDLSQGVETTGGKYWKDTYVDGTNVSSGILTFSHTSQFPNAYDGFVASNVADNSDFTDVGWYPHNQFAAMTKGGLSGIGKPYLVNYGNGLAFGASVSAPLEGKTFTESDFTSWVKIGSANSRYRAHSVAITNTSLAYYSMKDGDGFAKKFEDGDFFKINVYGVDADMKITIPQSFYLADYRSGKSMILDKWQTVNISSLGEVKYIFFTLESTDNGQFGMNTPAFFCLDGLIVDKIG